MRRFRGSWHPRSGHTNGNEITLNLWKMPYEHTPKCYLGHTTWSWRENLAGKLSYSSFISHNRKLPLVEKSGLKWWKNRGTSTRSTNGNTVLQLLLYPKADGVTKPTEYASWLCCYFSEMCLNYSMSTWEGTSERWRFAGLLRWQKKGIYGVIPNKT